jgi:hypothetical protein
MSTPTQEQEARQAESRTHPCRQCENEGITPPYEGERVRILWRPYDGEPARWSTRYLCEAHLHDDRIERIEWK